MLAFVLSIIPFYIEFEKMNKKKVVITFQTPMIKIAIKQTAKTITMISLTPNDLLDLDAGEKLRFSQKMSLGSEPVFTSRTLSWKGRILVKTGLVHLLSTF